MRRVLLLSVGMFVLGLDAYVLSGVLPNLSGSLHVSIGAAGQIVTAFTLSYALLSPLLAIVSATWPRRRLLIGALALFTVANIASATAPSLGVLLVARVVAGAGAGLYAPTAAATAAALVPPEQRARALALSLGGLITATVLGVPIGTALGTHLGWRATMTLVVCLGALAAMLLAIFLPDVATPAPPSLRARFATLADGKIAPIIALMFLVGVAALGLYTYLGTMLVAGIGVSRDLLPFYLMLWGAAGVAGNLTVAQLIDRGRRPLIMLSTVLVLLTAGMLGLHFAGPVTVLFVLVGYGIGGGSAQVPLQHRLFELAGDHGPVAVSLLSGGLYLGSAVGSALGAVAYRSLGLSWLGALAAAPAFAALLIALTLTRRQSRRAGDRQPAAQGEQASGAVSPAANRTGTAGPPSGEVGSSTAPGPITAEPTRSEP